MENNKEIEKIGVYIFGVVLKEKATRKLLFQGDSEIDYLFGNI